MRQALGQKWALAAGILGAVALYSLLTGLLLNSRVIRRALWQVINGSDLSAACLRAPDQGLTGFDAFAVSAAYPEGVVKGADRQ